MRHTHDVPVKKDCPHSYIRKAYYLGLPGEDYVCVACGESRPEAGWPNFWERSEPKPISELD